MAAPSSEVSFDSSRKDAIVDLTRSAGNEEDDRLPKKLVWRDIVAERLGPKPYVQFGDHPVLDQVSGVAMPGEITFIMGPIYSGKKTLLRILAQRIRGIRVIGEILVNGRLVDVPTMRKLSVFVQQENLFYGNFTVREILTFAANMKMSRKMSYDQTRAYINKVINDMELESCLEMYVHGGKKTKRINKGDRKRLAIACELFSNPYIIYLEQPIHDMEPYMRHKLMKSLITIAKDGKTIVCVVEDPSSFVFNLSDRLVLLSLSRVVFQGPTRMVGDFFNMAGYPCPQYWGLSDHLVKTVCLGTDELDETYRERIETLIIKFERTDCCRETRYQTHEMPCTTRRIQMEEDEVYIYAAGWFAQLRSVFSRSLKHVFRDKMIFRYRLLMTLILALMTSYIFHGSQIYNPSNYETAHSDTQDGRGLAWITVKDIHHLFLFPSLTLFANELPIVFREHHAGMYHMSAFFIGRLIAHMLLFMFITLIYSFFVFILTSAFATALSFFRFWFICQLLAGIAMAVAESSACLFTNDTWSSIIFPCFTTMMIMFGGFYVRHVTIPAYLRYISSISWHSYGYAAQFVTLHHDVSEGLHKLEDLLYDGVGNSSDLLIGNGTGSFKDLGQRLVHQLFYINLSSLLFLLVSWRLLSFYVLRTRVKRS